MPRETVNEIRTAFDLERAELLPGDRISLSFRSMGILIVENIAGVYAGRKMAAGGAVGGIIVDHDSGFRRLYFWPEMETMKGAGYDDICFVVNERIATATD